MVPYAKRMEKMAFTANVVKGLFGSMTNPDIISFSGGSPAREALPVDTIRQLADEVLRTDTRGVEALQYGPIEGIRDLREVVVRELLAPKGIDCGVDNVIIITGGLEGINLACLSEFCTEIQPEYEHVLVLNYCDLDERTLVETVQRLGNIFIQW